MKLLYKPLALISGLIAARVGKAAFKSLWSRVDERDPPEPSSAETTFPKVVGAATLEAVTMATTAATINRATAAMFHYVTGVWPGKAPETPEEKAEKKAQKKSKKHGN